MKPESIGWQKYAVRILLFLSVDYHIGLAKALWGSTLGEHIEVNPIISEFTGLSSIIMFADVIIPLGFILFVALLPELLMSARKDDFNLTEYLLERYYEK